MPARFARRAAVRTSARSVRWPFGWYGSDKRGFGSLRWCLKCRSSLRIPACVSRRGAGKWDQNDNTVAPVVTTEWVPWNPGENKRCWMS